MFSSFNTSQLQLFALLLAKCNFQCNTIVSASTYPSDRSATTWQLFADLSKPYAHTWLTGRNSRSSVTCWFCHEGLSRYWYSLFHTSRATRAVKEGLLYSETSCCVSVPHTPITPLSLCCVYICFSNQHNNDNNSGKWIWPISSMFSSCLMYFVLCVNIILY